MNTLKNAVYAVTVALIAVLAISMVVLLVIALIGFVVSLLWNGVIPHLFGLKEIDIIQGGCLFLLVSIFRIPFISNR